MNEALAARGIRFLVAIPPNAASIYQDDLPHWAQNSGSRPSTILFWPTLPQKACAQSTCVRRS